MPEIKKKKVTEAVYVFFQAGDHGVKVVVRLYTVGRYNSQGCGGSGLRIRLSVEN